MEHPLTLRQLCAVCLLAVTAPSLTVCAAMPWPWVLAISAAITVLLAVMIFLWRKAGADSLALLTVRAWGRPLGTAVLAGQTVFALLLLWRFSAGTDTAFPDVPTRPFVPLILLAVTAWAVWQGRRAAVRGICVLFFFGAVLVTALFGFVLPDAKVTGLLRLPQNVSLQPSAVLLLPVYGLYLAEPHPQRSIAHWLPAFLLLPPAAAAVCAAVPGSRGSFYTMAKSVEVLSVARRIEPLVSASLTAGWFTAMVLVSLSVGEMVGAMGGRIRKAAVAACILALPSAWLKLPVSDGLLLWGAVLFCAVLPLLTLLVVAGKKPAKIVKKGVDKGGLGW